MCNKESRFGNLQALTTPVNVTLGDGGVRECSVNYESTTEQGGVLYPS